MMLNVRVKSKPKSKIDKIAFISTYLNFTKGSTLTIATIPLKSNTNSLAKELNSNSEKYADYSRSKIAASLSNILDCKMLYGDSLHNAPGYNLLKAKYNFNDVLTKKDDANFPSVWQASNDNNFFKFKKVTCDFFGDGIQSFFEKSSNYKEQIIDICKNLDVNYVCLSYVTIKTYGNDVGINSIGLITDFYLFNKEGELAVVGSNGGSVALFDSKDIKYYNLAISTIPSLYVPIFNKMKTKLKLN